MEYRKFEDTFVVRLDRGDEVIASLEELCRKEDIVAGTIEGLGAADHAVVGLYKVDTREFTPICIDEPLEITSLTGNASRMNGQPYLHIHINLGDESGNVHGGHLKECRIAATAEIFIRTVKGGIGRRFDDDVTGLNLFAFDE